MNRVLKKLSSFLLIFIFAFIAIDVNLNAQSEVTDIGKAKYYVEEVLSKHELSYGVKHQTVKAFTSAAQGEVTSMGTGISDKFVPDQYYQQQVNVLEVPSTQSLKIRPWAYLTMGNWNLSTVRNMAKDYEEKNPGSKVIAAINADFFDINSKRLFPKTPTGAHATNGDYYKSISGGVVGFTNNGTTESLIGNESLVRSANMTLSIYDSNDNIIKDFVINKINTDPDANELAIYYAKWNWESGWASQKLIPRDVKNAFVVNDGELALPSSHREIKSGELVGPNTEDFYGRGVITEFGDATLDKGDFAIVSNNPEVTAALKVGTKIRAQYSFTGTFADVKDIVGVGQTVLYNGVMQGKDTNRHPRTMIGVKEDGTIIMTVVDGRQQDKLMYGASQAEMAAILKHYGAVEGYNLDGGGSSTMLILNDDGDLKVTNSPSDKQERTDSNCILITIDVPHIEKTFTNISTNSLTLNTKIINKYSSDFDELYVKIGDEMKIVENDKVVFTNLNPNTKYQYALYGKKGDKYNNLAILGSQFTAKREPRINKVLLSVAGDTYTFEIDFYDPDKAISRRSITMGDEVEMFTGNRVDFEKYLGDITKNLTFSISYDLNDGKSRVDADFKDNDVTMSFGLLVYSKFTSFKLKNKINSIFEDSK